MTNLLENRKRPVAIWLYTGVWMIVIQVVLGGITRLTESGLSITEWNPITGVLPPLNESQWMVEFDKYKNTDQFKYVHAHFSLSEFKFIFFWEWFHRLWARLIGVVFLVGFVYLLATRRLDRSMRWPMFVLFLLGALQGAIGWIMVKSGLVPEKYFVGHVELATHFLSAMVLLVFTLWYALRLTPSFSHTLAHPRLRLWILSFFGLLFLQLVYGAFMAGMKAGMVAPTWPTLNGAWVPERLLEREPWNENFTQNPMMVQFIHRGLAYLIGIVTIIFFIRSSGQSHAAFTRYRYALLGTVMLQILLGILTVLHATQPDSLLWLGVAHQFVAMMLVILLTCLLYLLRDHPVAEVA